MKRNYGIDLLRMVAMVFVIVLHLTGVGGICGSAQLGSPQFYLAQLLRIGAYCAVNCYALISGFVGWNRRTKLSGLLMLWLKVIGFCVAIAGAVRLLNPAAVGFAELRKAITPVLSGNYWYFNAYVGLFFLTPLLNHGIRSIPEGEAVWAAAGIGVLVLASPLGALGDSVLLNNGYSTLWLAMLYLLGGLMSRFRIPQKLPAAGWAGLYLLAVAMGYLPRMALLLVKPELWSFENQNLAMQYTGPSVVLAATALAGLFARLEPGRRTVRITKAMAPHAFGVYLFHANPLIFLGCIWGHFTELGTAPVWKLLAVLFGVTALIYAAGTAADWALTGIMKLLRLDRLLKKLDERII